jgi:DNA-binding LacI/PurR family transcriptional regulator
VVSQTIIARKLNLSQRTVSLCLAGSDRVAENTRKQVVELAQRLGYRPNRSALAMRSGRFNAVALLQSTHTDYSFLPSRLVMGLQEGVDQRRMHLVLASVPDEKLVDSAFLPSVLREWSVDGFLVNYNYGFSQQIVEAIESNRSPSIWLNTKRERDCVYPDDIGAGRKVTEHLLSLGHKRIAFFSHRKFEDHYSVGDRYAGYELAMRQAGLSPRKLFFPDIHWDDAENGLRYVHTFLNSPDRPTAIVSYEAFEASRVLLMSFKLQLEIPRDLSLVTFHERECNNVGFPISTMEIPEAALGNAALDLLQKRIEDGDSHLPPMSVEFIRLSGTSTAVPRE